MPLFQKILQSKAENKKLFAVLIDPQKCFSEKLIEFVQIIEKAQPDFIFVGGSQLQNSVKEAISEIKTITKIPVVLFPGNPTQFSENADAVLFLSLISGNNPAYLIGEHRKCALTIKNSGIEVISTGYILVDGKKISAVEQVSNTQPLSEVSEIVSAAVAGELLGCKIIYLEAGSGAKEPVSEEIIRKVRTNVSVPLIVGGGLRSKAMLQTALNAGADIIVVGNYFEKEPEKIFEFCTLFR
ncbi:MAG: geranylgeranylglyceryl/heptaprenylglyceryl phosphate synthase [Prevotellaceae bacterium]|jgi:putative glycerol-1-phosphate prenyltransferase|nr:geranylgeranylglyceryl/heptaprenylglyceryl phosphate synthase [Prevotellaceae bacterium]